ncbi:glycine betaine ABC transporter substrate-binding protein [Leekyejoonella antrihumi]|nr:glycine betaine ABC transporter substrate-binding protein [Leekyejoonella antrihumi]
MQRVHLYKSVAAASVAIMASSLIAACGASKTTGSDATGTASAGNSDTGSASTSKTLTIPIASGWAEDEAVSYLWQYVLQKKGYQVKLPTLDIGVIFAGISKGSSSNVDVFFDTWLPTTHKAYWAKIHNKVEDIGIWYDQATLNLAVPKYMTNVNSIADLKGKASLFNGHITGIDPGAGETGIVKNNVLNDYGLSGFTVQTSSSAAMLAALSKAIDAKQPIVVTLWHPHWAYKAFPIKDLKDPKKSMGSGDKIHVIAKTGFKTAHPDVYAALAKFKMTDAQLADLENVALQKYKNNPAAGVAAWAKTHQSFVNAMM